MSIYLTHMPYPLLWTLLSLALLACDTTIKTDEAEIGAAVNTISPEEASDQVYRIDTARSRVTWIGARVTGRQNGLIPIQQGHISLHNGKLHGGEAVFDMQGLRSADKTIDAAGNTKLTNHLRSEDFFDVARHPTARFVITSVVAYDSTERPPAPTDRAGKQRVRNPTHKITGNLTIKGITRSISFPARVTLQDKLLSAKANFNIDRTQWKLSYGADKSLGNQTIYPAVNIGLGITAVRQKPSGQALTDKPAL